MRRTMVVSAIALVAMMALAFNADAQMMGCKGKAGDGMMGCRSMMGGKACGDCCMHQGMCGEMGGAAMGMGDKHSFWKHLGCLGLTDQQNTALKTLRMATMKDMITKKAEKQIAEMELKDLLDKDEVDMKAVEMQFKKVSSIKTDLFLSHLRSKEQVKSILTPEQWKRFKAMMEMDKGGPGPGCQMMMQQQGTEDRNDGPAREQEDAPAMHENMH